MFILTLPIFIIISMYFNSLITKNSKFNIFIGDINSSKLIAWRNTVFK